MPNMFGGDQLHPAYAPFVKLEKNQVTLCNDLWTIDVEAGMVDLERIDGGFKIFD